MSDDPAVLSYVDRTGIPHRFYASGLNAVVTGSAADQITDALNDFSVAMGRAGYGEKMVIVARCTIVVTLSAPRGMDRGHGLCLACSSS